MKRHKSQDLPQWGKNPPVTPDYAVRRGREIYYHGISKKKYAYGRMQEEIT